MLLEHLLLAATLIVIVVNLIGWEGLRRYFKISRGKDTEVRQWGFLHGVLPWMARVEFIYYLALAAFAAFHPGIFPVAVIFFLVLYHLAGFILNESHEAVVRRQRGDASSHRVSSVPRLSALRVISFLDGFEMALLVYLCLIMIRRSSIGGF